MSIVLNSEPNPIISYSLQEILSIADSCTDYKLTDNVVEKINELSSKVGAPSYNRTPIFGKQNNDNKTKKKKNKAQEISDEDWNAIRNFQATQIEQKEGIDKIIVNFRGELNKITDKNYDVLLENIKKILHESVNHDSVNDCYKENIAVLLFDIATTNKFYSHIYAKLYKELIKDFSFIEETFTNKFSNYLDMFKNINYVHPDVDYNNYCKYNKENESRRALSMFIVNMVKLDVLSTEYLFNLINEILDMIREKNKKENFTEHVDELVENIFVLITESHSIIKEEDEFECIFDFVKNMKSQKSKENKSLSNKTIFKFMDIYDFIEKEG